MVYILKFFILYIQKQLNYKLRLWEIRVHWFDILQWILKRNDKLLLIPSCWVRFIFNQAYHSLIFRKFILLQKLESSENLIFIPLRGKINSMGSREEIKMPKKWSHWQIVAKNKWRSPTIFTISGETVI